MVYGRRWADNVLKRRTSEHMEQGRIVLAIIGFVPLIGVLSALIYGFVSFDCLVETQYETDHAAWVEDGKPCGNVWRSKECAWWSSTWAKSRVGWRWLFKTPDWAKRSPTAQVWLRRYRISIFVWNVGFLPAGALALICLPH